MEFRPWAYLWVEEILLLVKRGEDQESFFLGGGSVDSALLLLIQCPCASLLFCIGTGRYTG